MEVGCGRQVDSYSADEVPEGQACNLFEITQIIDRRPRNSIEKRKDTPKMGHASSWVNLLVPPQWCIPNCLDFYHEFGVSLERALSAVVGPSWRARDFHDSQALADLR